MLAQVGSAWIGAQESRCSAHGIGSWVIAVEPVAAGFHWHVFYSGIDMLECRRIGDPQTASTLEEAEEAARRFCRAF